MRSRWSEIKPASRETRLPHLISAMRILGLVAVALLVVILAVAAVSQSRHISYTLAGTYLPCTVDYAGRAYDGPTLYPSCPPAIVAFRPRHPRFCQTPAMLRHEGYGPLHQVGTLWELPFGPAHQLATTRIPPHADLVILFVADGSCFVPYELEGGP